jgi:hypothetical protein
MQRHPDREELDPWELAPQPSGDGSLKNNHEALSTVLNVPFRRLRWKPPQR